jgi:hypothetical protein
MDNILEDDISWVLSLNIEFFFKHFIDTSLDNDSNNVTGILVVAATLFHEPTRRNCPSGMLCAWPSIQFGQ